LRPGGALRSHRLDLIEKLHGGLKGLLAGVDLAFYRSEIGRNLLRRRKLRARLNEAEQMLKEKGVGS